MTEPELALFLPVDTDTRKKYIFVRVLLLYRRIDKIDMTRVPTKVTNERREKVWFLMLQGHNPQSIRKTLNLTNPTIYSDIKFLTQKSKKYLYDMAKGTHVLLFQRAIEGIGLTLSEAWNRYNDPRVPEKQKLGYLRLTMDCNESMMNLTVNGPTHLSIQNITDRANRLGLLNENEKEPLSEQEEIDNYANTNVHRNNNNNQSNV